MISVHFKSKIMARNRKSIKTFMRQNCHTTYFRSFKEIVFDTYYRGLVRTGATGAWHPQNFKMYILAPAKF